MAAIQDGGLIILQTVKQYKCICSSCFKRSKGLYVYQPMGCIRRPPSKRTQKDLEKRIWKNRFQSTFHKYFASGISGAGNGEKKRKRHIKPEKQIPLNEMLRSEVFLESPTCVEKRQKLNNLNSDNFWDFVFSFEWEGRLRLCEGELMYRIRETFRQLVRMNKMASFTATRYFSAGEAEGQETGKALLQCKCFPFVTRVDFVFYGGTPRKRKKMVQFYPPPFSVFTPRLRCITGILKRDLDGRPLLRLPTDLHDVDRTSPREIAESRSGSKYQDNCRIFGLPTEQGFERFCLKAADDFVVVEEIITNSKTHLTSTNLTLRRKQTLYGTSEIADYMRDFYTSSKLPEYSYNLPEFKPVTRLLEMNL